MQQEELIYKFNLYEQQVRNLQEQMKSVDEGILDLENLNSGLDELKENKEKEILAPIGRGIFIKSKIISDDLMVDIGGGNFVKRDIEKTKELLVKQINKLAEVKEELNNAMENLNAELNNLMNEINESETKNL